MWVGDRLITDPQGLRQAALAHMASLSAANQWNSRIYDLEEPESTLIPDGPWKGEWRANDLLLECMNSKRCAAHSTEFDTVFQPPTLQEFQTEIK